METNELNKIQEPQNPENTEIIAENEDNGKNKKPKKSFWQEVREWIVSLISAVFAGSGSLRSS